MLLHTLSYILQAASDNKYDTRRVCYPVVSCGVGGWPHCGLWSGVDIWKESAFSISCHSSRHLNPMWTIDLQGRSQSMVVVTQGAAVSTWEEEEWKDEPSVCDTDILSQCLLKGRLY